MNGLAELKHPLEDRVPGIVSPFLSSQQSAAQSSGKKGIRLLIKMEFLVNKVCPAILTLTTFDTVVLDNS